ncbi:glycosyltransferase family 4 protein [Microbacterium capsulatum]|uniref:Glycosyltransferase family 4 protein n=1 Tax=Microbacterium capsulatum TaxID=3041921 RepID=A0ABU0XGM1_9MICO|nr:glycosyltransferase family 4 protein [Microbacterium sp. ASV81]MDQ4214274.1 glycosyltransferase family 4 protein [Microbacterium sp. ASV81]
MGSREGTRATRIAAALWGGLILATDLLPPRVRYGYVHRWTRAAFSRPLRSLAALPADPADAGHGDPADPADAGHGVPAGSADAARPTPAPDAVRCLLVADGLDVGGIGTVIEMLALGLAEHGVHPVVLCPEDGARAARLRAAGIEVLLAADTAAAHEAIRRARPDVIQLHSAPPPLERAALDSGRPLIPVMHNTEIHFTRARWARFAALMARSAQAVAVSETVSAFHRRRIGDGTPTTVIPNGSPAVRTPSPAQRRRARSALSDVVGTEIGEDVVFVCLARYDAQKNTAGLVAAFTAAIEHGAAPVRLVWAGDPSDAAEVRRADAVRRCSPAADRIHLLGNSDAGALLAAADAFVLDSFFEGWPMAATEASAIGLPLVLSDVGGARELVARDVARSVLVPNATGPADLVSDARVRAARWRSAAQTNAATLGAAVSAVTATVLAERSGASPHSTEGPDRGGVQAMRAAHAALIRGAARHAERLDDGAGSGRTTTGPRRQGGDG